MKLIRQWKWMKTPARFITVFYYYRPTKPVLHIYTTSLYQSSDVKALPSFHISVDPGFHCRSYNQSQLPTPVSGSSSCLGPRLPIWALVMQWLPPVTSVPPTSPAFFFWPHFSQLHRLSGHGHAGKGWGGACLGGRRGSLMQSDAWRKAPSRKWHGGGEVSAPWGGARKNSFQVGLAPLATFCARSDGDGGRLASATSVRWGSTWLSTCVAAPHPQPPLPPSSRLSLLSAACGQAMWTANSSRVTDDVGDFSPKVFDGRERWWSN